MKIKTEINPKPRRREYGNGKYDSRILDPATTVDGSKSYIRLMPIDTTIQLHFPNIFYLG